MNNSNRLKLQAKEIVSKIPNTPNLEIILLCGSVAQGIADEYSDIELKFVWKNEPSKPERDGILEKLEGEILFKEYFEDYEWYLTILVEGIKIDISHCTLDTIHNISDKVFNNLDTSIDLQAFISSIIDSTVLRGDIDELKNKLGIYPEALSVKCIEVNLIFESWTLRDVLLKRKDYLTLESILIQTILQILRMLFALNKVYLRSHNFKWLKYQVNHLKLKPEDLEERILQIVETDSYEKALKDTNKLIEESYNLVGENQKEVNLQYARKILGFSRIQKPL